MRLQLKTGKSNDMRNADDIEPPYSQQPSLFHFEVFVDQLQRQSSGGHVQRQSAQFGNPSQGLFALLQQFFGHALLIDVGDFSRPFGHQRAQILVAYGYDQRQMPWQQRRRVGQQLGRGVAVDQIGQDHD